MAVRARTSKILKLVPRLWLYTEYWIHRW